MREAARRRATYHIRMIAVGVALLIFAWRFLIFLRDSVPTATQGQGFFSALSVFSFFYALLIGLRTTSDCLSVERREGTLGLLFLTDLKGYDIVLGKLVASSLNAIYGLLAIIPILAIPIQLGGVAGVQLAQVAMVLANTMLFSLSAGIFISTLSRDERKAMVATFLFLFLMTAGPIIGAILLDNMLDNTFGRTEEIIWPVLGLSPFFGMACMLFGMGPFPAHSFWCSQGWVLLASVWLLLESCLILQRNWRDKTQLSLAGRWKEKIIQWAYGNSEHRRVFRRRLLEVNPFFWLAARERWKPSYAWIFLVTISSFWVWGHWKYSQFMYDADVLIIFALLAETFLKIWIASEASLQFVEANRSGALELLLSTPLSPSKILQGQWLALLRQFAKPLALFLGFETLLFLKTFSLWLVLAHLGVLLLDFWAAGSIAMWIGLSAKSTSRALLKTMALTLALPVLLHIGTMIVWDTFAIRTYDLPIVFQISIWLTIFLAVDFIAGYLWARRRLRRQFRASALTQYEGPPGGLVSRWFGIQETPAPKLAGN
jgi:hypothetical protein